MTMQRYTANHRTHKRERKFAMGDVPWHQADARWQCRECENVTETVDHMLCIHCRLDAEDRAAGRYQEYEE